MPGFFRKACLSRRQFGAGRRVAAAPFRPRRSLCEEAPDSWRNIICSAARASDYAKYVQPAVDQRREQRRDHDSNNDPLSALTTLPGLCQRLLLRHCRHRQPRTRRKSPDFISRVVRSMARRGDAVTRRTRRMPAGPNLRDMLTLPERGRFVQGYSRPARRHTCSSAPCGNASHPADAFARKGVLRSPV